MKERKCAFSGCNRITVLADFCNTHDKQYRSKGFIEPLHGRRQDPICRVNECDKKSLRISLCYSHYNLWKTAKPAEVCEIKCDFHGCVSIHYYKGLCVSHYLSIKATKAFKTLNRIKTSRH